MASITKVFHVEVQDKHTYFGSKKAIFDVYKKEDIGITYSSFRNYPLSADKPFNNGKCIIREGVLITASKNKSEPIIDI